MHITPLYEDRSSALATAQVLDRSDGDDVFLEAMLQFVNNNYSVEYDFSVHLVPSDDQEKNEQALERLLSEVEAVNALHVHVTKFKSTYLQAASAGIERLAAKAGM